MNAQRRTPSRYKTMNRITSLLVQLIGVKRPKPRTRFGRYLRRSERVITCLLLLYLGLRLFPEVIFAHSLTERGITLYSREPLPPEAAACARRAAELVGHSELAVPGSRERVYICNAPWVYRLFGPFSSGAFAFYVSLIDRVFVAVADPSRDTATRAAREFNSRSVSGVVAHEITHGLIRHRLGLMQSLRLPGWIAEGYCDYVACESSFPESDGRCLMAAGESDPSRSFRYFVSLFC